MISHVKASDEGQAFGTEEESGYQGCMRTSKGRKESLGHEGVPQLRAGLGDSLEKGLLSDKNSPNSHP